jgi:hypothetical protein
MVGEPPEERGECLRALIGLSGVRVAGMQVHDRGAGRRSADRGFRDLLGGDWQIGRHRGGVDGAGHGAGDDDLAGCRHLVSPPSEKCLWLHRTAAVLAPAGRPSALLAANRFWLRRKMRDAWRPVNIFKKSLNLHGGPRHQCLSRPISPNPELDRLKS